MFKIIHHRYSVFECCVDSLEPEENAVLRGGARRLEVSYNDKTAQDVLPCPKSDKHNQETLETHIAILPCIIIHMAVHRTVSRSVAHPVPCSGTSSCSCSCPSFCCVVRFLALVPRPVLVVVPCSVTPPVPSSVPR